MLEIRWHARGGQGAKTASQVLALAALARGAYVQAFPEYGPERSGAPMRAFNRIDEKKIRIHYNIYEPDVVVVIDDSLLNSASANVIDGLKPDGILLVNTKASPEEVRRRTGFPGRIMTVDADGIAARTGVGYANIPTLGALARAVAFPLELLAAELKKTLGKKAPEKLVRANLTALEEGYAQVSANGGEIAQEL